MSGARRRQDPGEEGAYQCHDIAKHNTFNLTGTSFSSVSRHGGMDEEKKKTTGQKDALDGLVVNPYLRVRWQNLCHGPYELEEKAEPSRNAEVLVLGLIGLECASVNSTYLR